jgi:dynein light chain LC8-type
MGTRVARDLRSRRAQIATLNPGLSSRVPPRARPSRAPARLALLRRARSLASRRGSSPPPLVPARFESLRPRPSRSKDPRAPSSPHVSSLLSLLRLPQALEKYNIEKDIAAFIKKEFDKKYNPTWHCIVGRNFGSYVTHETKHFIYFYLGQVAVLLFKSG